MQEELQPNLFIQSAAATPLFRGLDSPAVGALLARPGVFAETYQKGSLLYATKNGVHCIGFLASGSARVIKSDGAGKMLMSVLHVGDVFGAATLFADDDCVVANIHAMQETCAVFIPEKTWVCMTTEAMPAVMPQRRPRNSRPNCPTPCARP